MSKDWERGLGGHHTKSTEQTKYLHLLQAEN